jgi:hypothetical protein
MKLRIHDNSIRLRLTRSEVSRFASAGAIESAVEFGPAVDQRMRYGLESSLEVSGLEVRFVDQRLRILLPAAMAKEWTAGDQVGVDGQQSLSAGRQLDILVEKEFRRLHGAKFDPDLYPNPLEAIPAHS